MKTRIIPNGNRCWSDVQSFKAQYKRHPFSFWVTLTTRRTMSMCKEDLDIFIRVTNELEKKER